jgi:ElaB/YqjD/DUF883 family membrane-anchored ribosome-binding protein
MAGRFNMATTIDDARAAVRDRLEPALENVERTVRDVRRAVRRSRYAAEDFAADTARRVRQRPLASLGWAVLAGAVVGAVVGLILARGSHEPDE